MGNIKKIKLFSNDDHYSKKIALLLKRKLKKYGFLLSFDDFDLGISIGGDGSFLRMVRSCNFDSRLYYVGINTGTLGFAQEIYPSDIDLFLKTIINNEYKIENISIQETSVILKDEFKKMHSLNEIVIRDGDLGTIHLDLFVNDELLENFAGDGILISTSFGSSAYNLSFGGSLVYNDLHVLQITPIAPLNCKTYHSLRNSVIIPEKRQIIIKPKNEKNNLFITIDGNNYIYNNVLEIKTSVKKEKIKCLRMSSYDYTKRINEKFIKY